MFSGSQLINMDAKGRIAIPASVREKLLDHYAGRIVITAHVANRCLHIFPQPFWEERVKPQIEALPPMSKRSRQVQLLVLGNAEYLEIDGNGRVLLPQTLRGHGDFEKKLRLIGMGSSLELWSEDNYQACINEDLSDEEMPEELMKLAFA